jgi:hypothetical protein
MREGGPSKCVALRRDMALTQAVQRHMTFQEIIRVTVKSKRWDVTLRRLGQMQCGFGLRSGSSSEEPCTG